MFAPTDGILLVTDETERRQERGVDFGSTDGLTVRHSLAYRQSRLRTEDMDLAQAEGVQVTRKVVCRRAPDVDAGTTVTVDGRAYDVTRVDLSPANMTLWLSELTTDGTCTLLATKTTRDARGESSTQDVPTTVYVRRARMGGETHTKAGAQTVWPTVELTIRAIDWDGERSVEYRGVTYEVASTKGDGRWLILSCEQGAIHHGK